MIGPLSGNNVLPVNVYLPDTDASPVVVCRFSDAGVTLITPGVTAGTTLAFIVLVTAGALPPVKVTVPLKVPAGAVAAILT